MASSELLPIVVGPIGPVGGAIDGSPVEKQHFSGGLPSSAFFLLELQRVDPALHVPPRRGVDPVPAGAELLVHLSRRLGHDDERVRLVPRQHRGDERLARAWPAGEDDSFHRQPPRSAVAARGCGGWWTPARRAWSRGAT